MKINSELFSRDIYEIMHRNVPIIQQLGCCHKTQKQMEGNLRYELIDLKNHYFTIWNEILWVTSNMKKI